MNYYLKETLWLVVFLFTSTIISSQTFAQPAAQGFDIRGERGNSASNLTVPVLPEQTQALNNLRGAAKGKLNIRWSRFTGSPSRLMGQGTMLTPPSNAPPHAIVNSFLVRYRRLFNLSAQDVKQMRFSRDFQTGRNGVTHLTLQQQVDSIDVFGGSIKFNIDAQGQIINVSGEPISNAQANLNTTEPTITGIEAVEAVSSAIGVVLAENVAVQGLILFPVSPTEIRLAWRVNFEDAESPSAYDAIVDASDGTPLWWKNLTEYDHFATNGDVFTSDSPYPVTPIGTGYSASQVNVPFHGGDFFAHDDVHYDWWNAGSRTTTTSNNVDAYADRDGDDVADTGSRPTAAGDEFIFPINLTQQPDEGINREAAVVNLFYWNNRMHDFFYQLGFDEAAGNFQVDNFGLGGSGGDDVRAEAQDNADGDSRCNANMSTWPDGTRPKMQMYVCGGPPDNPGQIARDGDLEATVIGHEYTHGVHSRTLATSGNQRANEGWCDYFGLAVVAEADDPYDGRYGVGDWLFFGNGNGIRYAPYTTDQSVFDLTYADLNGAASCEKKTCQQKLCRDSTTACTSNSDCTGIGDGKCAIWPGYGSPTCTEDTDCSGTELCGPTPCQYHEDCDSPPADVDQGLCKTSVYRTGEIWAETLWIMRMNIVHKYGFASGNRTVNELVMDGMIFSPDHPTLLDGRDFIINADLANNSGVNECLIWDAFAKMGMGYSAETTGVEDINPLEGFDMPPWCSPSLQTDAPADFGTVCTGETGEKKLGIYNTGSGDLIITSIDTASGGSPDISVAESPETPVFIDSGGHVDFTVYCTPSSPGVKATTIQIVSNDSATPLFEIAYTCSGGEPDMELFIANTGSFGDVCLGALKDLDLTIQNNGTCNLSVASVTSGDGNFLVPYGSPTMVVEAGNSVRVPIRYQPLDVGTDSTVITVSGNDGSQTASVDGESPPAVISSSIADSGDFGEVCSGSFKDLFLTVNNDGGCPLSLISATITGSNTGDFQASVNPGSIIESGNALQVPIRFAPNNFTNPSPRYATVGIAGKTLGASGALPVDSTDVQGSVPPPDIQVAIANSGDFGEVCKGGYKDLDLTLFNQGHCELGISSISITQAGDSFELPNDVTFPLVLSHDAEFILPIRYDPDVCNDTGETATIVITSDDPDESPVNVQISGSSPCPNLVIDPNDLTGLYTFPATVVDVEGSLGCYSDRTVTLRNNGGCPLTISNINAAADDFSVMAPTEFPVILPTGEETLEVTVRFTPQADSDPLAPGDVTGLLTITSDDPDASGEASLCGESTAQSGVRILVTDISSGTPLSVEGVDAITISSKGKNLPSPINLRFTDQPISSATVCGNDIVYHINQETLPETNTSGNNPKSSYSAKAKEGNLQASESFTLGQCEFRNFQLQLVDEDSSVCLLKTKGESCETAGECCSGKCNGKVGSKVCK